MVNSNNMDFVSIIRYNNSIPYMEELRMTFGEVLHLLRKREDLKQEDVAHKIGVQKNTISNYENNVSKPHYEQLIKLCNLFKVDPNYLMQDDITIIKTTQLNPEDKTILDMYKSLTPHDKEIVDHIFNMKQEEPAKIYRFPVYDQDAAAGIGRLDISDGYSMENFIVDNIPDEAAFIMEIAGESMYSEKTDYLLHTGSKIVIDPKVSKYNLDEKIIIANFRGKIICKRYIVKDTYILFQSDNDVFEGENRKSTDDPNYKIIGAVLGVIENEKFIRVK